MILHYLHFWLSEKILETVRLAGRLDSIFEGLLGKSLVLSALMDCFCSALKS
jgi:hypothetical protein